jgi:DNA-directed RNA polymerase subunit RPC12/RpoP
MAETGGAQRAYRAPCPGCGAPVAFQSAQSTHAVCAYCHSMVVRRGEALQRVGRVAELFDDHSPLQLGAAGRITLDGAAQSFTLIGRVQYAGDAGRWTEWTALLADGSTATLSEDNGAYVFTRPVAVAQAIPGAGHFVVGEGAVLDGQPYSVAANLRVLVVSAEGELPSRPPLDRPFQVVELRNADGDVLAIDYARAPPEAQRGRAVRLDELAMSGLKAESAKDETGTRQFSCPNCGSPVAVQLDSTQGITCPACRHVIDLSGGIGGELKHARQTQTVKPVIALGSLGKFQGESWQVVGFQRRSGSIDGDGFRWDEYLLYHAQRGFQFLVDSSDGWSLVRPTTGAPTYKKGAASASYLGSTYRRTDTYPARTDYVEGEFYWPVKVGDSTRNTDFVATSGAGVLSREQTGSEVTWSHGEKLDARQVAQAFGLGNQLASVGRADAVPWTPDMARAVLILFVVVITVMVLLALMGSCSQGGSGGGRSAGGSFGGYSSGGSHK